MTVANQTNRIAAVGNAAIGQEVPFSFPYAATSDITVYERVTATGVETLLAETTNYTLTAASDTGGTLTTVTAVAATSEIHIIRDTPKTQSLDLEQGGSFNAENIEDALDKNTKLVIENRDSLDRALRAPATDAVALDLEIPNSVDRAGKNLGFDDDGNVTVTDSEGTFTTTNAYWGSVITKSPKLDIRAFLPSGYVTNGSVDYATQIQAAIDEIKTVGNGCLLVPLGTFRVNTSLDCTGFLGAVGTTFKGLNIEGVSMNGSRILGATSAKPIFDFTASGYCSIDKLRITGHTSDTPNVGILLARNAGAVSSGFHNFRRIFVEGLYTKGGIYNYASEENVFDNIRITMTDGSTAVWCIAFVGTNYESITSDYETIHPTGQPMTRITLLAPQLKMVENQAIGTCMSLYGDVRDIDCYGAYMYSQAQSHIRMYSPASGDPPYRISFRNLRAEGYATTSKPDYGIFMTGATTGSFNEIRIEDSWIDAYTYEIYQDNTASGTFMGVIDRIRTVHGLEMKFNKVRDSRISLLIGDLTVDTSILRSEITNYFSGTISLTGEESVLVKQFHTDHLFYTEQIRKADNIGTLDDTGTPSVALGNIYKTGGTTTITDFDDGVEGQLLIVLCKHSLTFDFTTAQDADHNLDGSSADITADTGDMLKFLCEDGTTWHLESNNDASADNN